MSEAVELTSWTEREVLRDDRREMNIRYALLAERRLEVSRYGKMARAA